MIIIIYKCTNIINNKIYIGQTRNFNKRVKEHLRVAKNKPCTYFHKNINKYGYNNFIFEEIYSALDDEEANNKETLFVNLYMSNDYKYGMNSTSGGGYNYICSQESNKKKSVSKIGEKNPNYGKPLKKETKEKLSKILSGTGNGFYGKKHSQELIDFLKNRPISDEQRLLSSLGARGDNNGNAKLTEDDVLNIRHLYNNNFKTQKELSLMYSVKQNTINQIVHRKRWTHI